MKLALRLALLALPLLPLSARAASIVFDGVLGNSGEKGETLVTYSSALPDGAGVTVDSSGFLWATGGPGRLNRYATDGRLIGSYPLANPKDAPQAITIVEGRIVVLAGENLYALDEKEPAGTPFQPLKIKARMIGAHPFDGKIAAWANDTLMTVDPAGAVAEPVCQVADARSVERGPDGSFYVQTRAGVLKFDPSGQPVTAGWPKKLPGSRIFWTGGHFYCFTHSSTIIQLSEDFDPAPGVILGGASGSVIAHMPVDPDLRLSTGIVQLRPGVFAVAGYGGAVMLASWNNAKGQLDVQRRIGGLPACRGVALTDDGWVIANAGAWRPGAAPDAPLTFGSPLDPDGMRQPVRTRDGIIAPALRYGGRTYFIAFTFQRDSDLGEVKENAFTALASAVASLRFDKREVVLVAEPDGVTRAFRVDGRGNPQGMSKLNLQFSSPTRALSSIASPDGVNLLAAGDGWIAEMTPDAGGFTEQSRWAPGEAGAFGQKLFLSAQDGKLWVSDTDKNRVLCYDLQSRELIGSFTDDLVKPGVISAAGGHAVVYDSGHQRLVRLALVGP